MMKQNLTHTPEFKAISLYGAGVATAHKSNEAPVFRKPHPVQVSFSKIAANNLSGTP